MLGVVGLVMLALVGERTRRARERTAVVRALPGGELREAFVRAEGAWRKASRVA